MKNTSIAGRWMNFLTGAFFLFAGAFTALAQTSTSNFQVTITTPTNAASFMAPTNIPIDALTTGPTNKIAAVAFTASLSGGGVTPPITIFLGSVSNGVPSSTAATNQELFALTWSNALGGTWAITAQILNSNGMAEAASPPVIISVLPARALSVDIASPTNGEVFVAPSNILLVAGVTHSGSATVSNVEFFDGTKSLGVASNGVVVDPPGSPGLPPGSLAFSLSWSNPADGPHVLTAVTEDSSGKTAVSEPMGILVLSNLATVVRITSPPNNAVFRAPVNIALLAYANDPAGYVAGVQFFAGANSLGFATPVLATMPPPPTNGPTAPTFPTNIFELTWSNAPVGSNVLTAVAIDGMGLATTSTPVNITILPPATPPTNEVAAVSIVATDPIAIAGTNCWRWPGLGDSNGPPTWSNWVSPAALWHWYTNCGPEDAIFTVHRSGATNNSLTVTYAIGGTASNGVDYAALPGTLTIPAGEMDAMITIVPMDLQTNSATSVSIETVILSLLPSTNNPTNYVIGFPKRAEALILGGQSPHADLTGSVLGDHSFHINSEGPDGAWFRVDYTTNGLSWTPVCTNQVINGSIDFADPDAPASTMRLYRAVPMPGLPPN